MPLAPDDRRTLLREMRTPALTFAALLTMLALIVLLGAWLPFRQAWIVEAALTLGMVLTVLLSSMEFMTEPPIIRFFSLVGFFWVAILFSMTLVDYLTR